MGEAGTDAGGAFILYLLDDKRIVPGASPETALRKQAMQVGKRRGRDTRRTDLHAGAGNRIQHPGRHHCDDSGRHLDMNNGTVSALLYVLLPHQPPEQRMPAIVDRDFRPDMGRMNG